MIWRALIVAGAIGLTGCNQNAATPQLPGSNIPPRSFALVPCGPVRADPACVLAVAGGKRVLFGAPVGVAATLSDDDLRQLDAVMLFSLRAQDMEGLDEVRNASWRAGRSEPLRVAGPDGTEQTAQALNRAYEQADALWIVTEGMPPGGFDAAVLSGLSVSSPNQWHTVFDTGDFKVEAKSNGAGFVVYKLSYSLQVLMASCGGGDAELAALTNTDARWLTCQHSDMSWPLRRLEFIVKE